MNKKQLIESGQAICKIKKLSDLKESFEIWKEAALQYAKQDEILLSQMKMSLHMVDTPYGTEEDKIRQYWSCINKAIRNVQNAVSEEDIDALETLVANFGLYLQTMFRVVPENKATLRKDILSKISIENEYDVQHMMYAMVKALYPSARREVTQDTGYVSVRFDIIVDELDTVIEIKCTRKDHTDNKLYRELGQDGYFYDCSRLLIYVYDKHDIISDVQNFQKSLERTKKTGGKDIKVYVEQSKKLL